jgi:O-antigen ligase
MEQTVRDLATPWRAWLPSLLIALLPLCLALSSRIKVLPLAILFVTGIVLLATRPECRLSFRLAWPVLAVCALRLLFAIGNVAGHRLGWDVLDLPAQILLFIAIAAVFSLPLKPRLIRCGFSLTAVVLGLASLYQRYVLGVERPFGLNGGDWAAIEFAMFLLVLVLLAILHLMRSGLGRSERIIHAGAIAIGLYGAVLTQSRGPLLAFAPLCVAVMAWHVWRSRQWRGAAVVLGAIVLGMLAVSFSLHREMAERLRDVQAQAELYSSHNDAKGAVGERLAMWRTAWSAYHQHPWAGIGWDQFGVYARQEVAAGRADPVIAHYVHPHSEYLEALAAGGLPGLIVLLLFFAVPLAYFLRHLRHPRETVATAAVAGLIVLAMYVICAFGDNVFYRAMPQSLYLLLVPGLAVYLAHQRGIQTAGA